MCSNEFKVSYVTTLPKEANVPRISVNGPNDEIYNVSYYEVLENNSKTLIASGTLTNNQTIIPSTKQYFTKWYIEVTDSKSNLVFSDTFNPKNKVIFIKMDSYALGDTLAWITYVEEFRLKHKCTVICSTFHNEILIDTYSNILFVKPNTVIDNVYAQYYIGADYSDNVKYSPINVNNYPLQEVASRILGLNNKEIKPDLTKIIKNTDSKYSKKYVTISEFGSGENKSWKYPNGWQNIVDYLVSNDYDVVVISREKTNLTNIIDSSGDFSLQDRMRDIYHAEFHIGVSSGLSWLAWSLNKHVILISDVTPKWHEFISNVSRVGGDNLICVNYNNTNVTDSKSVINEINLLIN